MTPRAALFDLDGTLIDSTADIAWSANTLLAENGYPTHPIASFTRFIGDGVRNLVIRILPEPARTPDRIDAFIDRYRALYADHWNVNTYIYPGILDLLQQLTARNLRLAVLSNKPHDFTLQCVNHYFPQIPFNPVMGAGTAFPHKPDPAAALHIAAELAIPPADFLYLGDTDTDMQTATRAGMVPIGVLWGLRDRPELEANGAKSLIAHPAELLQLLPHP